MTIHDFACHATLILFVHGATSGQFIATSQRDATYKVFFAFTTIALAGYIGRFL